MKKIKCRCPAINTFILRVLVLSILMLLPIPRNLNSQSVTDQHTAEGNWISTLDYFRFVLRVTEHPQDSFVCYFDFPDQEAWDIPVDIQFPDTFTINFDIYNIRCRYTGRLDPSGDTIRGNFIDPGGGEMPVTLARTSSPPVRTSKRPQEPVKPYPYSSEEVMFMNTEDGITLKGTLTIPRSPGPFRVVVLISGSGPNDRDQLIWGHRPFLVLADYLTRQGIAVLRYDDRGVGRSTGINEDATFLDFSQDALAAYSYLRTRPEIDPDHIGLLGHSEGAAIAPIAGSMQEGISFVILLAAPGFHATDDPKYGLTSQFAQTYRNNGASEEAIAFKCDLLNQMFRLAREHQDPESAKKKIRELLKQAEESLLGLSEEERIKIELESVDSYDIEWIFSTGFMNILTYDPQSTLSKVSCPVLALHGTKDMQIPVENLHGIEEALQAGGNRDFKIVKMDGLNHLFQTAETGEPSEYSRIEETIAPEALSLIADWIKR